MGRAVKVIKLAAFTGLKENSHTNANKGQCNGDRDEDNFHQSLTLLSRNALPTTTSEDSDMPMAAA